ncbi:hypothetical protein GSbR_29270 [Geobacter sp. SVR]|nr:hypothetical protein GSbR_29270 [Geobacter sp. SVR]
MLRQPGRIAPEDPVNTNEKEELRLRLARLAWLMDNSIPIPGGAKIGIDPLIGLIPWVGDLLGALVSSFILSEAARLGIPKSVLLKMAFNTALDALIGAVPFLGDLFDFAWKANMRNVRLLEHYLEHPRATVMTSRLFVALLCLLVIALVVLIGLLGFLLVRALWQAVSQYT